MQKAARRGYTFPINSLEGAVQEVARVELQARLRREHLHHAARRRLGYLGRQLQRRPRAAKDEVVVVARSEGNLRILRIETIADGCRLPEVERRTVHFLQLAGWDESLANRSELVCVNHHHVPEDIAAETLRAVQAAIDGVNHHHVPEDIAAASQNIWKCGGGTTGVPSWVGLYHDYTQTAGHHVSL